MNKQVVVEWMKNKGVTVIEFAKIHKVARQSVYQAIGGYGSRRLRVAIAVFLAKPPSLIWQGNKEESLLMDDYFYMRKLS